MRQSVITSALLHIAVLLLAVLGLPHLWDRDTPKDTPVIVEVVKIDDKTRTDDVQPTPPPKAEPKTIEPPPEPPKARSLPTPPKPPEIARRPEPEPEKVPVKPKPEKKPEKKAKPKPKPKPEVKKPPKSLARARPRRRPSPSREDFAASVLKDLAPEERAPRLAKTPERAAAAPKPRARAKVRNAPLDARATMSEIDAIRRQIEQCWNIPAGARDAENLVVSIRVWVNADGSVGRAVILDSNRMAADPFFRSAAESALRAVLNPRCSPLRIPPNKYEQFKVLVLNFNPREAAGS